MRGPCDTATEWYAVPKLRIPMVIVTADSGRVIDIPMSVTDGSNKL